MKIHSRLCVLAAAGVVAAAGFPGCGGDGDAAPPLVVGMDLSYPPFETIDEAGRPRGVSVELAEALAQHLGRPLRIENIAFAGLIPSLQTGKIDCIISSMTDTPERRNSIAFSDPYLTIGLALLTGKESKITSPENLDQPGVVIAVRQGTTGQVWAEQNIRAAQLLVLPRESAAVLEVIQGKADAFLYDQMSVWRHAREHPESLNAILEPVRTEQWAIGLRTNDDALREQVNAFLRDFRANGGFERLGDQYLSEQKSAFEEMGLPFYF